MIISRYLIKEVLTTLLAVTFVLMLIFLSNQLVRYLSYAASGKIAANILWQLLGFEIPALLGLLLPLGMYLGIILAYGKLYADSELRVLHACGFGMSSLIKKTSILAFFMVLIISLLMLVINPLIAQQKARVLQRSASGNAIVDTLIPGRFQVSSDGLRVVYVEKMSRNRRQANNIFIAIQGKSVVGEENDPWEVLSATKGFQITDHASEQQFFVATDGYRYTGRPGMNNYKIMQFKKYAVRTPAPITVTAHEEQEAVPTLTLLTTHNNPEYTAEFQWRLAIPISALLLALLAVPLSQVKPREGRYSMLFVARNLLEQKIFPLWLGMWWVHITFLIFIMVLLGRQCRWRIKNL
jgi:lipopolysaccharide export system permease protein